MGFWILDIMNEKIGLDYVVIRNRLPTDDSVFLAMENGRIDLSNAGAGSQLIAITKPEDGSVSISGECWGWTGDSPTRLSSFDMSIPENDWNDSTKEAGNENCSFSFNLKPIDDGKTYQTMNAKGSGAVPPPFNVRSLQNKYYENSLDPSEEWSWFWEREAAWERQPYRWPSSGAWRSMEPQVQRPSGSS